MKLLKKSSEILQKSQHVCTFFQAVSSIFSPDEAAQLGAVFFFEVFSRICSSIKIALT